MSLDSVEGEAPSKSSHSLSDFHTCGCTSDVLLHVVLAETDEATIGGVASCAEYLCNLKPYEGDSAAGVIGR